MATIKLQTGKVLDDAKQGFHGVVPFKCWSRDGTEEFLEKINQRNEFRRPYLALGPAIGGLSDYGAKGGRHSTKTRRRLARIARMKRGTGKQDKQYNVRQVRQTRGFVGPSARDKARRDVVKASKVRMG